MHASRGVTLWERFFIFSKRSISNEKTNLILYRYDPDAQHQRDRVCGR